MDFEKVNEYIIPLLISTISLILSRNISSVLLSIYDTIKKILMNILLVKLTINKSDSEYLFNNILTYLILKGNHTSGILINNREFVPDGVTCLIRDKLIWIKIDVYENSTPSKHRLPRDKLTLYFAFNFLIKVRFNHLKKIVMEKIATNTQQSTQLIRRFRNCTYDTAWVFIDDEIITNQTIFFQEEFQRKIEQEVEHFFNPKTRKRFDEYGLNYCQKYLFIGKPGTGKTSLIKYLAHKYKLDILQMTLSTSNKLPQGKTRKSIVVIEDIDTYLKSLYTEKVKSPDLTQLLNYLDGSQTPSNCLIIMTANNIEGLPDVLFRPGRINKTYKFPLLSKEVFLKIKSEFDIDGEWHDDMSTMTTA